MDFVFEYLFVGLIWAFFSYIAYHVSVILRNKLLLNAMSGISLVFGWIYYIFLMLWFFGTSYGLVFTDGRILLGFFFFFVLGGIIVSISGMLVGLLVSIPLVFSEKYDERISATNVEGFVSQEKENYSEYATKPNIPEKYQDTYNLIRDSGKANESHLQEHLGLSKSEVAEVLAWLEKENYIGPKLRSLPRDVYIR